MPDSASSIKILSLVEATTINAVAKNVLEFHRSAREPHPEASEFPHVAGSIVTFGRGAPDEPSEFVQAARELGLQINLIRERRRFDLSVIPALRKLVEETTPDLIITHSVKSHFVLWRSRLWQRFPWIAFHHGYTMTDRKMRVYNRVDRWSLPKADRIVTVCHAFARELATITRVPIERILVQHNSIRPQPMPSAEAVSALRTRLGIADDEKIVLAVGRLSREKAHIDLLKAFKLVRAMNPEINCKLIIVGDGPERARLEAAARGDAIHDQTIFTGQLSDVWPYYAAVDVFVLPSHSEGSPNALLEATAGGVPIVATSVGGIPEIVEDNHSALLVPANNPSALAAAIARLLTDSALARRLTANASALVVTKHSPETYVRSLVGIYQKVIHQRNG